MIYCDQFVDCFFPIIHNTHLEGNVMRENRENTLFVYKILIDIQFTRYFFCSENTADTWFKCVPYSAVVSSAKHTLQLSLMVFRIEIRE